MSRETKIEWCDSTVNYWSGCTKVSAGCAKCYAETLSKRQLGNIGQWGKGAPRKLHESAFKLAFQLNRKPWICNACGTARDGHQSTGTITAVCEGCASVRTHRRRRVFSLSLGDWLDPEVPIEWLARMLDTIRKCDQLQWLLVTKRPENFFPLLQTIWRRKFGNPEVLAQWVAEWELGRTIPKHIMVLTSVENQQAADERIPALLKIPAAQRGLSCEPLLGPVNLVSKSTQRGAHFKTVIGTNWLEQIDWVIVGGESGPGARSCETKWIRGLLQQCAAAGVATFVKQLGSNPSCECGELPHDLHPKGGNITQFPEEF